MAREKASQIITKEFVVEKLAEKMDSTKKHAREALDAFLEIITEEVSKGNKIQLIGFGTFQLRERKARKGRHPQTGEKIEIPSRKVPVFIPGKIFKEKCN